MATAKAASLIIFTASSSPLQQLSESQGGACPRYKQSKRAFKGQSSTLLRHIRPGRTSYPPVEQFGGAEKVGMTEDERLGVRDLCDERHRVLALEGIEHVADRQAMGDDEDGALGPGEEFPVTGRVAPNRSRPAFASARRLDRWFVGGCPLAVVGER